MIRLVMYEHAFGRWSAVCQPSKFRLRMGLDATHQWTVQRGRGMPTSMTQQRARRERGRARLLVAPGFHFPYSQARLEGQMRLSPCGSYAGASFVLGSESVCSPVVSPLATVVATGVLLVEGSRGRDHFVASRLVCGEAWAQ